MFYRKENKAIELTKNEAILTMYAGESLGKMIKQTGINLSEAISAAKSLEKKGVGAFVAGSGDHNSKVQIDTLKKEQYKESMIKHYREMISGA